jgi:hypothetical protein
MNAPLVTEADHVSVPPPLFETLIVWLMGLPPPAGPPENDSDVGFTLIVGVGAGLSVILTGISLGVFDAPLAVIRMLPL